MAIEVVQGGQLAFDTLLFGGPDPNIQNYLKNQFQSGVQHLTDIGRRIQEESRQLYERFSGDDAVRYIKAVGRAVQSFWQTDAIRPIIDIGQLQFAMPMMQRWIMAEPLLRKLFHEQRVEGYAHHYVDMEPNRLGRDHYDYRVATQGLIQFNEGEDQPEWSATTWFEELYEGDQDLTLSEQADIQQTWEALRYMLQHGHEDPTSRFNATLD
jgi:hypothetical protein